ncbi:MAG: hypothetical protein FD123_444 [Bacteroidetes bacterium]|nr:MAG: hypothetical protein FD123_444 [Bacteroidota bacterium]
MKKICTVLLFCFAALGLSAQSGWTIVSQNYWLNDVFAIDADTVIAVGNGGRVMRSTDGGQNWKYLKVPTYLDLNGVYFISQTTGYICGDNGILLKSTNSGISWSTQSTSTLSELEDIFFVNANVGFMVGEGDKFMKTTNGGVSWTNNTVISSFNWLYGVHFVSADTGWVCGAYGEVYYTANGGSSWSNRSYSTGYTFTSVFFLNATTGYVSGLGPGTLRTVNSGTNWTQTGELFKKMYFANSTTGWGITHDTIKKTTDGGLSWMVQVNPTAIQINAVHFNGLNNGAIAGSGEILHTLNGGANWNVDGTDVTNAIYEDAFFANSGLGWVVGNNHVFKTGSGGTSWTDTTLNVFYMKCVHFINPDTGWAGSLASSGNGKLWRTMDGGTNWSLVSSTTTDDVWFTDFNNGFRINSYTSQFEKTTNSGANWTNISSFSGFEGEIYFPNATTGYCYNNGSQHFKTINGGATWTNPNPQIGLGVHFATPLKGWVVGNNGMIQRTNDGGLTWYTQTSGVNFPLHDICFSDETHGVVTGFNGILLETSNGGYTWTPVDITNQEMYGIHFPDAATGYAVGMDGTILKKDNSSAPVCALNSDFTCPAQAFNGDTLTFNFTGYGAAAYSWTDNSAVFSTSPNATLVVNSSGTHTICLTVTSGGCTDVFCKTFSAYNCETQWIQKRDFSGAGRTEAASFTVGSKGYLVGGWNSMSDTWEYDMNADTWTQKANIPAGRYGAYSFASATKGYVACGYSPSFSLQNDLWEYDPTGNSWLQKTSLPAAARAEGSAFMIGGKAYLCYGTSTSGYTLETWEYDPATDNWMQKSNIGSAGKRYTASFTVAGKGYVVGGASLSSTYTNDTWEYDPVSDSWLVRAVLPDYRRGAIGFGHGPYGYLFTGKNGTNSYSASGFRFDPVSNSWQPMSSNVGSAGREFACVFQNSSSVYVASGAGFNGSDMTTWQFKFCGPPLAAQAIEAEESGLYLYPNPGSDMLSFRLEHGGERISKIMLYDLSGRLVTETAVHAVSGSCNVSALLPGIYLYKAETDKNRQLYGKWIKR